MPRFRRLPLVALLTAAAGATHIAAAVPHFAEDPLFGVSFVAMGWIQLALAALLLVRPDRRGIAAVGLVNVAALVAWILSRTTGLPLGHPGPEPVALADTITIVLELAAVAVVAMRWRGSRAMLGRSTATMGVLSIAAVLATGGSAAAIATLGSGHGHAGNAPTAAGHDGTDGHADDAGTTEPPSDPAHEHADGTWHIHEQGDPHEPLDGTVHVHAAGKQSGPVPSTPPSTQHDDSHEHTH